MEAVEYFLLDRLTCYKAEDGVTRMLKQSDREQVTEILDMMGKFFPEALKRLEEIYMKYKSNKWNYEFRIVDHFIRCNFGEPDFLTHDVDHGMFNLEEVKCPLRGICQHEGVICKPKAMLPISNEEKRVVKLYTKGMTPGEIAAELGKSESTCKCQINSACKKLHLPSPRKLFRLFSIYHITL